MCDIFQDLIYASQGTLTNGAAEAAGEFWKLTTEAMERIIEKLESRKGIFDLHGIPIRDIIGALTEVVVESGYPEKEMVKLAKFVKMVERCTRAAMRR